MLSLSGVRSEAPSSFGRAAASADSDLAARSAAWPAATSRRLKVRSARPDARRSLSVPRTPSRLPVGVATQAPALAPHRTPPFQFMRALWRPSSLVGTPFITETHSSTTAHQPGVLGAHPRAPPSTAGHHGPSHAAHKFCAPRHLLTRNRRRPAGLEPCSASCSSPASRSAPSPRTRARRSTPSSASTSAPPTRASASTRTAASR